MADRGTRRRPAELALLVVLGAAAVAGSAALTWWTQSFVDSLAGPIGSKATGGQADSLLIPVALIGLAGLGAALATAGVLRRAVGVLLALAGLAAAALCVRGLLTAPDALRAALTRPPESVAPAQVHALGPVLGALGGLLIATAGLLVAAGYGARRGLGSRYDAPRGRAAAAGGAMADGIDPARDADAAAGWWKALDAGVDPTGTGAVDGPEREASGSTDEVRTGPDRRPPGSAPGVSEDVTRGS